MDSIRALQTANEELTEKTTRDQWRIRLLEEQVKVLKEQLKARGKEFVAAQQQVHSLLIENEKCRDSLLRIATVTKFPASRSFDELPSHTVGVAHQAQLSDRILRCLQRVHEAVKQIKFDGLAQQIEAIALEENVSLSPIDPMQTDKTELINPIEFDLDFDFNLEEDIDDSFL